MPSRCRVIRSAMREARHRSAAAPDRRDGREVDDAGDAAHVGALSSIGWETQGTVVGPSGAAAAAVASIGGH